MRDNKNRRKTDFNHQSNYSTSETAQKGYASFTQGEGPGFNVSLLIVVECLELSLRRCALCMQSLFKCVNVAPDFPYTPYESD